MKRNEEELAMFSEVQPVILQYLSELCWDGIARGDTWLSDYLGVEASDRTRAIGSKWLISAVARAYEPGCKVDSVLVLEGASGIGKSRALQTLGGAWHREYGGDVRTDAEQIIGAWICELSEVHPRRLGLDDLKAFLARGVDVFRPKYSRKFVKNRRCCVFAMTTNDPAVLASDPARRWWCVRCPARADIEGLALVRDQLWAEAVVRYRGGERWWLEPHELEGEPPTGRAGGISASEGAEELVETALHLAAARGWAVHPLASRAKTPATSHGCKDATRAPKVIRAWWRGRRHLNVGIATGRVSGFWALDVDEGKGGAETIDELQRRFGPLPQTLRVRTGSGYHDYWAYPTDRTVTNAGAAPGVGVDVRGDGGYVVGPGSIHPSGAVYSIERDLPIVPAPSWLLDLVTRVPVDSGGGIWTLDADEWKGGAQALAELPQTIRVRTGSGHHDYVRGRRE